MSFRSVRLHVSFAIIATFVPSVASAQTTLAWKWKEGDALKFVNETQMKQTTSIMGNDIKNSVTQSMDLAWTVGPVTDGTAVITQKYERIRQKMEAPGGQGYDYDSKEGKKPEGPIGAIVGPLLEGMIGAEVTMKMNTQGEASETKISEKFAEAIKTNPALAQMGGAFSEEGVKQMIEQSSVSFPKEAIEKGKTWDKSMEMKIPFGVLKVKTTFTYVGPEKRGETEFEKIDTKAEMTYEPAADAKVDLKIKSADIKGFVLFDNKLGRLYELSQTQIMQMEVAVAGQAIVTNQEQTISLKQSQ